MQHPLNSSPIILASQSPQRTKLLKMLGLEHQVVVSHFEEEAVEYLPQMTPEEYVQAIAAGKVLSVADQYLQQNSMPENTLILGGDLLVFLDTQRQPLGKPRDFAEAREFLDLLSGTTHTECCAACLWAPNEEFLSDTALARVTLPKLTEIEKEGYLEIANPLKKAGGFSLVAYQSLLQKRSQPTSATISGDISTVLGFPVRLVESLLAQRGVNTPRSAESVEQELARDIFSFSG